MKIRNPWLFWTGIIIVIFLGLSYFVRMPVDSGANYNIETPLLGILIFYNVYLLCLYVLIALGLVYFGLRK